MQLVRAQVAEYKSIVQPVNVRFGQVTCLQSESLQTMMDFYDALELLTPTEGTSGPPETDLPTGWLDTYREKRSKGESTQVIEAEFLLTVDELVQIQKNHGKGSVLNRTFTVRRYYEHDAVYYDCALKVPLPAVRRYNDYASFCSAFTQTGAAVLALLHDTAQIPTYPEDSCQYVCMQTSSVMTGANWTYNKLS